jgi:hypothetical protein
MVFNKTGTSSLMNTTHPETYQQLFSRSRSPWCFLFALPQNKRSLSLYTFLFYIHLFHVSSSFCFFCFRLFPTSAEMPFETFIVIVMLPYLTSSLLNTIFRNSQLSTNWLALLHDSSLPLIGRDILEGCFVTCFLFHCRKWGWLHSWCHTAHGPLHTTSQACFTNLSD